METIPLPNAQPDMSSSSYAIFKTVGAVIVALVTWIFVATVLNLALRAWWPHYHEAETLFQFYLCNEARPARFRGHCLSRRGFVAAWIAKDRTSGHAHRNRIAGFLHSWSLPTLGEVPGLVSPDLPGLFVPAHPAGGDVETAGWKRASSHSAPEQRLVFLWERCQNFPERHLVRRNRTEPLVKGAAFVGSVKDEDRLTTL